MNLCPPEILYKIFAFACTDGGATGCALSLVSSYVYAVSRPVQLHSVAVDGPACMRLLLSTLHARAPQHRQVHHLFLSHAREEHTYDSAGHEHLVHALLRYLCASLRTLSISLCASFTSLTFPSLSFPFLHSLSLRSPSFALPSIAADPLDLLAGRPITMSALHRLHLHTLASHGPDPARLALLDAVTDAAPELTHLRLSGLPQLSELPKYLAPALGATVTDLPKDADQPTPACRLPSTLQRLLVQPVEMVFWGECEFMDEDDLCLQRELRKLMTVDRRVGLVPEGNYGSKEGLRDWLDVVGGGEGCWRTRRATEGHGGMN